MNKPRSTWTPAGLHAFVDGSGDLDTPEGVVSARLLRRHADPHEALDALVATGTLERIRRGWYRLRDADDAVVTAVAAGGVLTCVSALAFHGIWVPRDDIPHARPARETIRLDTGVHHCSIARRLPSPVLAVDPVALALRTASACLTREYLVAAVDSAMGAGLARHPDLEEALWWSSHRGHEALAATDWAQSGTESLLRQRLRSLRFPVRTQVSIDGVGRVDLLVGDRLVIEADSVAHHTGAQAYRADRHRDLMLTALGYRVVRVSWEQVTFDWPAVARAVRRIVDAGEHRWPG